MSKSKKVVKNQSTGILLAKIENFNFCLQFCLASPHITSSQSGVLVRHSLYFH